MTHPNVSIALARVIIDELAVHGVDLFVISPGSRSGALAIAADEHPDVETRIVIDERSAAFHALGVARTASVPVAVLSTSGTAPANFFPAVVEADMSCVPIVVVSADRPAEMQGVGANQTIDQVEMFGTKVRAFVGIEAPPGAEDRNVEWRGTIARLVSSATGPRPGPVHLNVRFREPTVPVTHDGRTEGEPYPFPTQRVPGLRIATNGDEPSLPALPGGRGLVIAGDGAYDRQELASKAATVGWPILATALSGMRGKDVVSSYHHILGDGVPPDLVPMTVVAVGAIGPSSRLEDLVAAAGTRMRIDRWGRRIDPRRNATQVLHGDVVELIGRVDGSAAPEWKTAWCDADRRCRLRLEEALVGFPQMSGAAVANAVGNLDWGALVVASSLPIREVDAHMHRPGPVFANRGASGIDGFVSTALGVASRIPRTLSVSGDLSLLHDSNGFITDVSVDLTILVVDNEGGGLFDSLPQARHAPGYERLFVTNPNRSLEDLARFHGLSFGEATDLASLAGLASEALDRPGIDLIRVPVDRGHDLEVRAQLEG